MADNVTLNSGSGGATIATDNIGGVDYQRVKNTWGADGTATDVAAGAAAMPVQDGGNSLTVDDGGTTLSVDDGGSTLSVDDGGGTLTVDGTVTVDTISTSVTPGTSAAHLGKAEDAAHSSGDVGVMALTVRKDTAAALAGTDVDYQPFITDSSGRLHVNGSGVTQPVSAASLPLPSGAATEATLDARTGALTETAPATDTASSGLNGRLQRVAQRLTSILAKLPALGTAGTASSDVITVQGIASGTALAVTESSTIADDAAFTVGTSKVQAAGFMADDSSTDSVDEGDVGVPRMSLDRVAYTESPQLAATLSNVNDTASSTTLLSANALRKGMIIFNDSTSVLYVKFGATASATSFTVLLNPYDMYEMPAGMRYTGVVDGIWSADASGAARITELA